MPSGTDFKLKAAVFRKIISSNKSNSNLKYDYQRSNSFKSIHNRQFFRWSFNWNIHSRQDSCQNQQNRRTTNHIVAVFSFSSTRHLRVYCSRSTCVFYCFTVGILFYYISDPLHEHWELLERRTWNSSCDTTSPGTCWNEKCSLM